MKILHVTECFAGGVATAINMYASLAPEHEHMVLYTARRANSPAELNPELFSQSWRLPDQHRAAIETVRRVRDQVAPDVIHTHSSFAGAYVRLARLRGNKRRTPTVYTPHGVHTPRCGLRAERYLGATPRGVLFRRMGIVVGNLRLRALWPVGRGSSSTAQPSNTAGSNT